MGSCDSMMMIEAAFWNPAITGVGMNFTTRASRASPKASWKAPAIDISRKIAAITSSGSFVGAPTARCDPMRPSHPAPNVRDDREAPLFMSAGRRGSCL